MEKKKYENLIAYIRETINPDIEKEIEYFANQRKVKKEEVREAIKKGKMTYEELTRYNRGHGKKGKTEEIESILTTEEMDLYRMLVLIQANIDMQPKKNLDFNTTFLSDETWEDVITEISTYPIFTDLFAEIQEEKGKVSVKIKQKPKKAMPEKIRQDMENRKRRQEEEFKRKEEELERQDEIKEKRAKALAKIARGEETTLVLQYGKKENEEVKDYPLKEVTISPLEDREER